MTTCSRGGTAHFFLQHQFFLHMQILIHKGCTNYSWFISLLIILSWSWAWPYICLLLSIGSNLADSVSQSKQLCCNRALSWVYNLFKFALFFLKFFNFCMDGWVDVEMIKTSFCDSQMTSRSWVEFIWLC